MTVAFSDDEQGCYNLINVVTKLLQEMQMQVFHVQHFAYVVQNVHDFL